MTVGKMRNELKTGTVLSYLNTVLSIAIGLITAPLMLRFLGKSEYGAYQMTAALIGYVSILDLGLHSTITRYVSKYRATHNDEEQKGFIAICLIFFTVIGVAIIIISGILYALIPQMYGEKATATEIGVIQQLLIILSINLALSMPGAVFTSIITAYEKFVFSRSCTIIKMLIRLGLIFIALKMFRSAVSVAIIDLVLNILLIFIQIMYCFRYLKIKVHYQKMERSFIIGILSFSLFVFIASITEQINWKADTTILGILCGTTAVTYYSVAGNLCSYYRQFSAAISGVFLPRTTKMVVTGATNSELTDLMIKIGRIQLEIIGLILIGFVLVGREFITLWVGYEFEDAYVWFLIMAIPLVVPMTQSIGINILEAKLMHKFRAIVYLGIAIANVIFTILLVHMMGIIGAPVGTGLAILIGNNIIINMYYSRKLHLEIGRFFRKVYLSILPFQLIVLILGLICKQLLPSISSWPVLIIWVVCISVVYGIIIICFAMNAEEKKLIPFIPGRKA